MASCDGCQLTLLDLEDELLALAERFDIVEFPEASSLRSPGPYDVLLVEGSISTPDQAAEIVELRRAGEAARHHRRLRQLRRHPGPAQLVRPRRRSGPPSTPIRSSSTRSRRPPRSREHVKVDAELHGCPISPEQLREVLVSVAVGPPAADPRGVRLPRVQAARHRVRDGRAGDPVPRAGDPERLRGAVPGLRPWLLRLLRPAGAGERQRAWRAPFAAGGREGEDVSRLFAGFTGWAAAVPRGHRRVRRTARHDAAAGRRRKEQPTMSGG